MKKTIKIALTLLVIVLMVNTTVFAASAASQRAELNQKTNSTLEQLYQKQPKARQVIANSKGYAVFNNTGFKLGILGSSHGRGMAVNNLTGEKVYMKMKEYQAGLGLGIKEYAIIFVFTDSDSLNSFVKKGWSFGAQATAVADDGISGGALEGAIHVDNGVWMYQMTTKGLAAELAVKGTNYYRDKNLN